MAVDKEVLYGNYLESRRYKRKLHDEIVRKSLDMPVDDDGLKLNIRNGISGWQAVAAGGILAASALAGTWLYQNNGQHPQSQAEPTMDPVRYKVQFSTESGEPIPIVQPDSTGNENEQ